MWPLALKIHIYCGYLHEKTSLSHNKCIKKYTYVPRRVSIITHTGDFSNIRAGNHGFPTTRVCQKGDIHIYDAMMNRKKQKKTDENIRKMTHDTGISPAVKGNIA